MYIGQTVKLNIDHGLVTLAKITNITKTHVSVKEFKILKSNNPTENLVSWNVKINSNIISKIHKYNIKSKILQYES